MSEHKLHTIMCQCGATHAIKIDLDVESSKPAWPVNQSDIPQYPGLKGKNQRMALDMLQNMLAYRKGKLEEQGRDSSKIMVPMDEWRHACGLPRQRWHEVLTSFQDQKILKQRGSLVSVRDSTCN